MMTNNGREITTAMQSIKEIEWFKQSQTNAYPQRKHIWTLIKINSDTK